VAHGREQQHADGEREVIGDEASGEGHPQHAPAVPAHSEDAGESRRQAILAARELAPLHGEDKGELREGERDHRKENRLDAEGEGADPGGDDRGEGDAGREPGEEMTVGGRAELAQREGDRIGAEAEEHRMAEGDDAGVADDDVVARDQSGEQRDLEHEVHHLERAHDKRRRGEGRHQRQPQVRQGIGEAPAPRLEPGGLEGGEGLARHRPAP
jgi:hypothetical protein